MKKSRIILFFSVFITVLLFTALEMMSVFAHGGHDPASSVTEAVATVLLLPAYPLGAIDRHFSVPEMLYELLFVLTWFFTAAFWATLTVILFSVYKRCRTKTV